jgi:hypothetical protein
MEGIMFKIIITALILIVFAVGSSGQQYKLKKYVFGSSAATTTSANYKFYNTAGQSVIGKALNTQNTLYAGFWKDFKLPVQIIELEFGWNMISTYLNPSKPAMEDIWADILNEVLIVKDNNGNVFIPSFGINTIGNWDPLQAYQVYMNSNVTLKIEGTLIKYSDTPLHLLSGWNMAAYIKNTQMNIETALASLTDENNLVIAKNNDGFVYIPEYEVNTIGEMLPGQGYQIYLNNNCDLIYPVNVLERAGNRTLFPTPKVLKPEFTKTGSNQHILINIPGLNSDFEIGIYNSKNTLIGSGAFRKNISIATIWGDNEKTKFVDGSENNEKLKLILFDTRTGNSTEFFNLKINNLFNNKAEKDLLYQKDELYYIESINDFNEFTDEININPNPIRDLGLISLKVKNSGIIEINLFTVDGKHVKQFANGFYSRGEYEFKLSKGILTSGEYNLIYKSENIILSRKVIISE